MSNEEFEKRIEEYNTGFIVKQIEKFYNISLEERIDYINELIERNAKYHYFNISLENGYSWFCILKLMSIKTIQFNQLKDFYQGLDNKGKKEFQTELYETIMNYEWEWKWDYHVDDSDKQLKQFYNFDTINSKLEEIKYEIFAETKQDNHEYHEKLFNTFIERCSGIVIEDFKKSLNEFVLLMKGNLSKSTKKKLFSLPAHMRIYAFMEMYSTAKLWNFEDWYLTSKYDSRQEIRKEIKQQLKSQEDKTSNSKCYIKRKYPLIRPRVKKNAINLY